MQQPRWPDGQHLLPLEWDGTHVSCLLCGWEFDLTSYGGGVVRGCTGPRPELVPEEPIPQPTKEK